LRTACIGFFFAGVGVRLGT